MAIHKHKIVEGVKYDTEKIRLDLLPVKPLKEIAKVLTSGAKKYDDRNWEKGILFHRVYRACIGHLMDWWDRKDPDKESGLTHLAHAGCCILFLLQYQLLYPLYKKFDVRPVYKEKK